MLVAEHVLLLSRLQLSVQRQTEVSDQQWQETELIISRLQQHEPLQYVLGNAHFYGLELEVTPAVLIPRPETEELVDYIVRENRQQPHLQILDICTGSGCIPIALSAHLNTENVSALDISEPALAIARRNAAKYKQSITWLQKDILTEDLPFTAGSLDIIVSNPPYVLEQEKTMMRPNVLAFEPHLALFVPDTDALLFYRRIAALSRPLLKPTGHLYLEINEKQGQQLQQLLQNQGYRSVTILADLFGKERFIKAGFEHNTD
jgi:release factor glutamine methyltransferase